MAVTMLTQTLALLATIALLAPAPVVASNATNDVALRGAALAAAAGGQRCDSHKMPLDSKCTGCPPMYNGKLCASTTRYNNRVMGACGCAESAGGAGAGELPLDWWSLSTYTAAINCKSLDPGNPELGWCPSNCQQCYELCSTGGTTQGQAPGAGGVCKVFKIVDRCGDGFKLYPEWCSNEMSWQECADNPSQCRRKGNTNKFGYPAHFDLQDSDLQISAGLSWDNIEVTFEPVSCDRWDGPSPAKCTACEDGWQGWR